MNNDKANVVFRFIRFPEYIKPGARLLFREGRTKGMGRVTEIVPYEQVQNRWQKISRLRKNSGKLTLTLKKIKKVTFACPGKSPRKKKRIRIAKEEEVSEELSYCKIILVFILFFCFLLFMLTFIDPELFKLVVTIIWADPEHLFRIFDPANNSISETLILFAKLWNQRWFSFLLPSITMCTKNIFRLQSNPFKKIREFILKQRDRK